MSNEPVDAVIASKSISVNPEESLSLADILQETSIADYSAAVIAQQIERLRNLASDVDRQYAVNVRGRKIRFKDRVSYLGIREKVASRIAGLVENLLRLKSSAESATDSNEREPPGAISWNPDADGRGGAQR